MKCLLALLLLLLESGCIQAGYVVRLDENGGGRVTETLGFSARLLLLETRLADGKTRKIGELLTEARVKERAKLMGPDTTVESWKVEDTIEGGKQLTAVYRFKDINKLALCMYPLGPKWDTSSLSFMYSVSNNPKNPRFALTYGFGHMVNYTDGVEARIDKPKFPPISEQELQQVRQLLPVFKDMLKGFKLTVKFEAYELSQWATITRGAEPCGFQNHISLTGGRLTLLDVSDADLVNNDDALMALASWRQIGSEVYALKPLLPVPYAHNGRFGWARVQHAETREYY
jgi:hypothetical protein